MQTSLALHYGKALAANSLRLGVGVALSLAVSFAILAAQIGGVGATVLWTVGWRTLSVHASARGIPIDNWLIDGALLAFCAIVLGPALAFQINRWRMPALKANAVIPDQERTLILHLGAGKVLPLLEAILWADPALGDVRIDEEAGRLTARSLPFARYRPQAVSGTASIENAKPQSPFRSALASLGLPFFGGPRRSIAIAVRPGDGERCEVSIRSRFRTMLPVLDARAENRRTVEAIADELKARAPRLIAEQRAQADRALLDRRLLDAKLQVLRAQIEPHFLYNTLANVQYLIRNDPAAADAMLAELITYLRQSLPKMREAESSVGDEVALARSYLNVLRIRMGDRLGFAVDVPQTLESHPFPPMLLMSLVENAIKHGLEPKAGPGTVAIAVSASEATLRMEVRDDGVGFGAAGGSGIGLKNIRETLASMFGDRARLIVEPGSGHGVTAAIEVPRVGADAVARGHPGLIDA